MHGSAQLFESARQAAHQGCHQAVPKLWASKSTLPLATMAAIQLDFLSIFPLYLDLNVAGQEDCQDVTQKTGQKQVPRMLG